MFAKVRTCQPKSRAWNWRPAGWSSLHIHLRGTWWASHSDIQTLLPYLNKKARVKLCSFCGWNVPPFPYNHKFPFPYAPFLLDPRGLCEVGVKWTLLSPSLQTQSQAITIHCQNNFEEYTHEKNDSGTMSHDTILKWHFTPTRNHKNTMVYRHTISCKKSTYATTYAVCFPTTSSPPAYADLRISGFYLRAPFLWPPPFLPHHRGFIAWLN